MSSSSLASTASVTICSTTSSSVSPVVSTGDRVGRRRERRALAAAVALVAHRLLAQHDLGVGAELGGAAARALLGVGGEEDLDLGVGRDDGADVAALGDPVAVGEDAPLLLDQRLAHGRVGGDTREAASETSRLADALGDVLAVEQHAVAELDAARRGDRGGVAAVAARPARPRGTSPPCRGT